MNKVLTTKKGFVLLVDQNMTSEMAARMAEQLTEATGEYWAIIPNTEYVKLIPTGYTLNLKNKDLTKEAFDRIRDILLGNDE